MNIDILEHLLTETVGLTNDNKTYMVWEKLANIMLEEYSVDKLEKIKYINTIFGIVELINNDNILLKKDTKDLIKML
jgi:hypothetical protein